MERGRPSGRVNVKRDQPPTGPTRTNGPRRGALGRFRTRRDAAQGGRMSAPPEMLGQLVSMGALVGCTVEYIEILKRRAHGRQIVAEREQSGDVGLQGLVRVFLTDDDRAH